MAKKKDDRLFNPHGFRHFRRSHSELELRWGAVVFLVLCGVVGWVIYKGQHPDPTLLDDGSSYLKKSNIKVVERRTIRRGETQKAAPEPGRAHLPPDLAGAGWRKKPNSVFGPENLYVKINGRAGYFKSFGFKQLLFTTLLHEAKNQTIDIEMYNMGKAANALGAYAGELGDKTEPKITAKGIHHFTRNALYISRGPYYIRIIGSDEKPVVKQKLKAIYKLFRKRIEGRSLPWAYGFFITKLSVKATAISYDKENAFSFGFAKDVYKAKLGASSFMFITAQHSQADAKTLASQFIQGFLSYGKKQTHNEHTWVKDQYINTYATALAVDRWVVGVQGEEKLTLAQSALKKLKEAVEEMPAQLRQQAIPAAPAARTAPRHQPTKRRRGYQGGGEPNYGNPPPRRKPAKRKGYQGGGEPNYGNPPPRPRRRGYQGGGEPNYGNPPPRRKPTKRRGYQGGGEPHYDPGALMPQKRRKKRAAPPASRPTPRRAKATSTPTRARARRNIHER